MPHSYQQLTYDERCQISALKARGDKPLSDSHMGDRKGDNLSLIALLLGRPDLPIPDLIELARRAEQEQFKRDQRPVQEESFSAIS